MMPQDFHSVSLLAVDPGLRGCGVALFKKGVLHWAAYVPNVSSSGRGPVVQAAMAMSVWAAVDDRGVEPEHLIVEFPMVYPGVANIDVNDLLDIAGVAAAVMTEYALGEGVTPRNCHFSLPNAWKGNIKKAIMTERIKNSLTTNERMCIQSVGAKDHNTVDAVGLGLWQLGRLNRRVFN